MDKLFEQFIGHFIKRHAEQIGIARNQISLQSLGHPRWLVHTPQGAGRFALKPDILLLDQSGSVQAIVDTKWKVLSGDVEDSRSGVAQADMYQLFAYATRFESKDNVLLYPAVDGVTPKEYDASDRGKIRKIRIETVRLDYDLAQNRSIIVQQLQTILRLSSTTGLPNPVAHRSLDEVWNE